MCSFFALQAFIHFVIAQRVKRHHFLFYPFEGVVGRHAPVGGAAGEQFHHAKASIVDLRLEGGVDCFFGLQHVAGIVQTAASAVHNAG